MGLRILIAEDELIVSLALRRLLERRGHEICGTARTGRELIDLAAEHDPALLLVDVKLEDELDGIDAVREIHRQQPVSVIFVTASSDAATREKAERAHYSHYLIKPIAVTDLLSAIEDTEVELVG